MRKKGFRPVQEELGGPIYSGAVCIIWYMIVAAWILGGGFRMNQILFILAGLFPLYGAIVGTKRAIFYRKQRKRAINRGNPSQGKIVNVVRTLERNHTSNRESARYRRYHYFYYLEVEITDPVTGVANVIRSDAYSQSIDRYLGSPYVQVYTDESGWRYFLEDFQMKKRSSDPDIFPGAPRYRESLWGKRIMQVVLALLFMCTLLYILLIFGLNYAVNTVDKSVSADGEYTLYLQSVGSPVFFSPADGRLVLKKGHKKIASRKFTLADDGGAVRPEVWQVFWGEDYACAVISGDEQDDEWIVLYFDGNTYSERLGSDGSGSVDNSGGSGSTGNSSDSTDNSGSSDSTGNSGGSDSTGNSSDSSEETEAEKKIYEGYQEIYRKRFKVKNDSYIESYSAKGDSRIILHEDSDVVEYLVYDRESANGKCGLYVYYRAGKDETGSWSATEAEILDMYAYVYDSGEVIKSGKTTWSDTGTKEYQEATGEP